MRKSTKAVIGRPSTYSRNDIVDCALDLLARAGVAALTLRGVARELGCVLGTVNYHFKSLADLEDAVAARLLERPPVLDAARPQSLRDQLVELGLSLIEINSTHPYLSHIVGPVSVEIVARQLRQDWATLRDFGLPDDIAMLCIEVVQSLAQTRGNEMHRLRNGGEQALRLNEELTRKLGKAPKSKLTVGSFTVASMEPFNRTMLGTAIDIFLRGYDVGESAKSKRGAVRKKP